MTEDMRLVPAVGADIAGHVLDDAQQGGVELAEHVDGLAGVDQRHVLRGRHDDRAGHLIPLAQRQLDVAGARRQVHHQHVEGPPRDLPQHLLQRPHQHRPAPDDRLAFLQHQADRHGGDPVGGQGQDRLAVGRLRAAGHAHHAGLRGTVDVGIQKTRPQPLLRQRHGQVRGQGGLADPALAGPHGDDGPHAGHRLRTRGRGRRGVAANLQVGRRLRRGMGGQRHGHVPRPRDPFDRGDGRRADGFHGGTAVGGHFQNEAHPPPVHAQRPDHVGGHHALPGGGIGHAGQGGQDIVAGDRHGALRSAPPDVTRGDPVGKGGARRHAPPVLVRRRAGRPRPRTPAPPPRSGLR